MQRPIVDAVIHMTSICVMSTISLPSTSPHWCRRHSVQGPRPIGHPVSARCRSSSSCCRPLAPATVHRSSDQVALLLDAQALVHHGAELLASSSSAGQSASRPSIASSTSASRSETSDCVSISLSSDPSSRAVFLLTASPDLVVQQLVDVRSSSGSGGGHCPATISA
eukprot:15671532-Heterocapsa_arctica.AAC.2